MAGWVQKNAAILPAILGPCLLLGWRLAAGQVLFWGTPSLQFVPWWMEAWRQISQGSLPLWNPLNGFGAPLLANYQSAFFYPPNWILCGLAAVFGAGGVAWGYTFLAMLHLIWAGVGMVYLLRRLGLSLFAQMMGGLAFSLCGYLVARLEFISMIWVVAWLPWILRYTDELVPADFVKEKQGWVHFPHHLAICIGLMLLAGHAQLSWYTLLLSGMWLLTRSIPKGFRAVRSSVASFILVGLAGALIAAIQLLPTAEFLLQSQRSNEYGYAEAVQYSFWSWRWITLFAPDFFGNPGYGNYWGYATFWEDAAYIGMLPILLALTTIPSMFRKRILSVEPGRKGLISALWILVFFGLILALGQNTPIFPFLYHYVPTFALFQAPARFMIWVEVALIILFAVAIDRWECPQGKGLYWLRLGTAGAFAVALGAGLAWMTLKGVNLTFIRASALAGFWALGTGGLTLILPLMEKKNRILYWKGAVLVWVLVDLLSAGWVLNPTVPLSLYASGNPSAEKVRAQLNTALTYMPSAVEEKTKFTRYFLFKSYRPTGGWDDFRSSFLPNLNLLDSIGSANNFDPMVPGRYLNWIQTVDPLLPIWRNAVLSSAGVGLVADVDSAQPGGIRFDPIQALPRYVLYTCADVAPDLGEVLQQMEGLKPGDGLLILEGANRDFHCPVHPPQEAEVISHRPSEVRLAVDMPADGWVVAAQPDYPGWLATVDGRSVPLQQANYLFSALAVPAGKHVVVLEYRSVPFYIGALLSILMLVLIVIRLAGRTGVPTSIHPEAF